jgi:hypothetical protein
MEKHNHELEFVASPDDILRVLIHSKEYGNVIGLCSPILGGGIFITAVDKVILDYEVVVQLKPYDVNGIPLDRHILRLSEISSACAFKKKFDKIHHKLPLEPAEVAIYSY